MILKSAVNDFSVHVTRCLILRTSKFRTGKHDFWAMRTNRTIRQIDVVV